MIKREHPRYDTMGNGSTYASAVWDQHEERLVDMPEVVELLNQQERYSKEVARLREVIIGMQEELQHHSYAYPAINTEEGAP